MPGGRGVHDDDLVPLQRIADGEQAEDLVETRRGEIDQVLHHRPIVGRVELRSAPQRLEQLLDGGAISLAPLKKFARGVQLASLEMRRHQPLVVAQRHPQDIAERMRRIGREDEYGIAAPLVLVNALTPPGCSRCRRAARAEAGELARMRRLRRGWAMLGAPAVAPPPRGIEALLRFGRAWTRIE